MGSSSNIFYCVPPLIQNQSLEYSAEYHPKRHPENSKGEDMEGADGFGENIENAGAAVEVASSLAEISGDGKQRPQPGFAPPPPYTPYHGQHQTPSSQPGLVNGNFSKQEGAYQSQPRNSSYTYQAPTFQPVTYHQSIQAPSASGMGNGMATTRTLHIYNSSCGSSKSTIFHTDKTTPLYTVAIRMCKPNLTISLPSSPIPIATAVFHDFHSHIDVLIRGVPITLRSRGILKSGHSYASPALGGEEIVWKKENRLGMDMRCENSKGSVFARYKFSHLSWKKSGSLELMGFAAGGGRMMEEMVVMGMVMVEHELCVRAQGVAADVVGAV
ncbi:MAG: hypothetical protein LQ337_007257 [Flavoplaca oasis]|nr:MAG: hypothetical protein LQ337_007257 [Flavoplaca oasis]